MTTTAAHAGTFTLGGQLEVCRLGFGAMRLTGDGIWGEPADREQCKQVLKRALELGINLIDTADSYGPEVSEEIIAEALHPYPDELVIATKAGLLRDGPNQWRPDCGPEHLKEACEGSLRRLEVDRIDLYQLHTVDPKVPYEASVGAIKELQDEGRSSLAGVSNVDVDQVAASTSSSLARCAAAATETARSTASGSGAPAAAQSIARSASRSRRSTVSWTSNSLFARRTSSRWRSTRSSTRARNWSRSISAGRDSAAAIIFR